MTVLNILLLISVPVHVDIQKYIPRVMISLYYHNNEQDFMTSILLVTFTFLLYNAGSNKLQFQFLPITTAQRQRNKVIKYSVSGGYNTGLLV
jgi:hypothetical protein